MLTSAPRGNSVVCCVKFSADGKYLATGCNRAAQIFDAKTGAKTWCVHPYFRYRHVCSNKLNSVLVDDKETKYGDLYIRSVCFSPDGKYLATGAEDRQIRVSCLDTTFLTFLLVYLISFRNVDLGYCKTAYSKCL